MNIQENIHIVVEPVAIPYLQKRDNSIFQQDNARPHTAALTTRFSPYSQFTSFPWQAKSADLSPIENVRDITDSRLCKLLA